MVLKQACHTDTSSWNSFSSFSWLAFFLLFYRQKEGAQEENDMGYYHFYRIFENNDDKLIISRLPQLWPVPISGRQKTVREDKLFLLNSAWKVMKKGRKQIYYSYKFTQVLSTQTSYFSLPSALLCISPRVTPCHYPSNDPAMYVEISIRRGGCVSVCAFLLVVCMTRTWLQSSRASALHSSSQQNIPAITGTIMPH